MAAQDTREPSSVDRQTLIAELEEQARNGGKRDIAAVDAGFRDLQNRI